jgi:large subunit ribosomal protein L20
MTRVKRGKITVRNRKKRIIKSKGFRGAWGVLSRPMLQGYLKAMNNSYNHRNKRMLQFRRLWIARSNAIIRACGLPITYNKFMKILHLHKSQLNRNILVQLAIRDNLTFLQLIKFYFQ